MPTRTVTLQQERESQKTATTSTISSRGRKQNNNNNNRTGWQAGKPETTRTEKRDAAGPPPPPTAAAASARMASKSPSSAAAADNDLDLNREGHKVKHRHHHLHHHHHHRVHRSLSAGVPTMAHSDSPLEPEILPAVSEEDVALPPPSPGTPPKKLWEHSLRSFLKNRKGSPFRQQQVLPPPPPIAVAGAPHQRSVSEGNHHRFISINHGSRGRSAAAAAATEPSERSVRGGKKFSAFWPRNTSERNLLSGGGDSNNNSKVSPAVRRRVKSWNQDELDGTLRRGAEKAYSPGNTRFVRQVSAQQFSAEQHFIPPAAALQQQPPGSPGVTTLKARSADSASYAAVHSALVTGGSSAAAAPATPPSRTSVVRAAADELGQSSSSAMKKAFTEFHNSAETGRDAAAAYLGDEPSAGGGASLLWTGSAPVMRTVNSHGHLASRSAGNGRDDAAAERRNRDEQQMPAVAMVKHQDHLTIQHKQRMLKPVTGVEAWLPGRRYLIAPAALAACPVPVLTTLMGSSPLQTAAEGAADPSPFGAIDLGECLLTYVQPHAGYSVRQWSSAVLVLRQNYLLEYDVGADLRGLPRGVAHLQYSSAALHPVWNDAVQLEFYASPCAKADRRLLMIRCKLKKDRDHVCACLNRAAALQSVYDLYDVSEQELGSGQYVQVRAARRRYPDRDENEPYDCAIKIFDKNHFWRMVVKERERSDTLVRETSVQATLTARCGRVSSFLRLNSFFETADHVVLELELLSGTDLFQHISKTKTLNEKEAAAILRDILRALEAMNRIGLAHRDIKPANVLVCRQQQGLTTRVKVCDFGMATFVGVDGHVRGRCGTPGYVAPEIFTAGVHGGYGNKVDIFSAGVTLYVMLCGYEPFYGETNAQLVEANKEAHLEFPADEGWSSVSDLAIDLIRRMMRLDPEERLDAKQALQHPWFAAHLDDHDDVLDGSISLPKNEAPTDGACVIS